MLNSFVGQGTSTQEREVLFPVTVTHIHNTAPRSLAELVVHRVVDNKELLGIALREVASNAENNHARSRVVALSTGTIRWVITLDELISSRYRGKYKKMRAVAKNALRVAVFQLMFMPGTPASAVINHATGSVRKRLSRNEANIVNALLRTLSRELKEHLSSEHSTLLLEKVLPNAPLHIRYSHPKWMVDSWLDQYGEQQTTNLLQAHQQQPHFGLRTNVLRASTDQVLREMEQLGVHATPSICKDIVLIESPANILESDAYKRGWFSIQDPAAGLVTQLLQPAAGSTILDMCAAPGGKSIAAAQYMENNGSIVACDVSAGRLKRVSEAVHRLGASCVKPVVWDGTQPMQQEFDIVTLDAPCSGTGTIARKPDVKLKDQGNIAQLVELQRRLLANAAAAVRMHGRLLYSTCSIEVQENQDNVAWFLSAFPEFTLVDPRGRIPDSAIVDHCMQVLPGNHDCDGAFAALFEKK